MGKFVIEINLETEDSCTEEEAINYVDDSLNNLTRYLQEDCPFGNISKFKFNTKLLKMDTHE